MVIKNAAEPKTGSFGQSGSVRDVKYPYKALASTSYAHQWKDDLERGWVGAERAYEIPVVVHCAEQYMRRLLCRHLPSSDHKSMLPKSHVTVN